MSHRFEQMVYEKGSELPFSESKKETIHLYQCVLNECLIEDKDFKALQVEHCTLKKGVWKDTHIHEGIFRLCDLSECHFINCTLTKVTFIGCTLSAAQFQNCTFTKVIFEMCDLNDGKISTCVLDKTSICHSQLRKLELRDVKADGLKCFQVDLEGALVDDVQCCEASFLLSILSKELL